MCSPQTAVAQPSDFERDEQERADQARVTAQLNQDLAQSGRQAQLQARANHRARLISTGRRFGRSSTFGHRTSANASVSGNVSRRSSSHRPVPSRSYVR